MLLVPELDPVEPQVGGRQPYGRGVSFIVMTNDYGDDVDDGDGKKQDDGDNVDGAQVDSNQVPGGVDFTGCVTDPDTGFCCVDKLEQVRNYIIK